MLRCFPFVQFLMWYLTIQTLRIEQNFLLVIGDLYFINLINMILFSPLKQFTILKIMENLFGFLRKPWRNLDWCNFNLHRIMVFVLSMVSLLFFQVMLPQNISTLVLEEIFTSLKSWSDKTKGGPRQYVFALAKVCAFSFIPISLINIFLLCS